MGMFGKPAREAPKGRGAARGKSWKEMAREERQRQMRRNEGSRRHGTQKKGFW